MSAPPPPAPPTRKKYTLAEVFGDEDDDDEDNGEDVAAAAAGVGGARQDFGRPAVSGKLIPLRSYLGLLKVQVNVDLYSNLSWSHL